MAPAIDQPMTPAFCAKAIFHVIVNVKPTNSNIIKVLFIVPLIVIIPVLVPTNASEKNVFPKTGFEEFSIRIKVKFKILCKDTNFFLNKKILLVFQKLTELKNYFEKIIF